MIEKVRRLLFLIRLRPFDTSNERGRSNERYRRAALTTMASVIAKAIALLAGLVSVPLTFRYLGVERYGIWMVLVSIIAAMGFADLGIGNGLMNAVSLAYGKDDKPLAREYVTSAFALMMCIAAFLAVTGAVSYPFLPWLRIFNVNSEAVATEGAKAFLVLYGSFVVSIPLGVIMRAQAGLQKGYASQIVSALGSILSRRNVARHLATLQPGLACLRFRLRGHRSQRAQRLASVSTAPLADAVLDLISQKIGKQDTQTRFDVLCIAVRICGLLQFRQHCYRSGSRRGSGRGLRGAAEAF